jgi:hypothetical protein
MKLSVILSTVILVVTMVMVVVVVVVVVVIARSDIKEPSAREYNWATLLPEDINTGTSPSRLGESQMRQ